MFQLDMIVFILYLPVHAPVPGRWMHLQQQACLHLVHLVSTKHNNNNGATMQLSVVRKRICDLPQCQVNHNCHARQGQNEDP